MSTPYYDIYKKANSLFEDSDLLNILTDEEYTELLEIFQSRAKTYFKPCKVDLNDVNDDLKQFNQTLSNEEQWIIAEAIKLVWIERQLYKEEKLRDKITTKDYNAFHSPANLIDKLILLKNDALKSLRDRIISYSFNEFDGFN